MEVKFVRKTKSLEIYGKELNDLDKEVINFIKLLSCDYAIVSGYITILFGRPRTTEDVDIIANIKNYKEFYKIWEKAYAKDYYCINEDNPKEAYAIISEGSSIRFARNNKIFPNFELKIPKNAAELIAINEKLKVKLGKEKINISPIELQIAYKIYLGSDKDYEDARYLYLLLLKYIDKNKLKTLIKGLGVEKEAKQILGV